MPQKDDLVDRVRNLICTAVLGVVSASAVFGEELRNGAFYPLERVPTELIARASAGMPVRFVLEENGTTGYRWEIDSNTNECVVVVEHRGASAADGLAGASGRMSVAVTSKVQTPARVEFSYRRPWEKGVKPVKSVRFILYTAADKVASPLYPDTAVDRLLKEECAKRGIALEIQAGSPYPRPKFLRLAKEMGARFSFGTNNFDPTPKDLSRWLEAITWLDLKGSDIWTPSDLKR